MPSYATFCRAAATLVAVAFSLFHVYIQLAGPPEPLIFRSTHLLFALVLVFLLHPGAFARADRAPGPLDLAWLAAGIACVGYVLLNHDYLIFRFALVDDIRPADWVFGTLLTLVVLEGTRRVIGWALPVTALAFMAYALVFTSVTPQTLIDQIFLTTEGIFGMTLSVSATFVVIFVLFGSFMERSGTGQLFMDFSLAITGRSAGGPGKVAVISSSLFGTISGSAVANVMVDGPITIPLMKRTGFRPAFAAAVEAVASTGGQIMPPVMGAAAFVMAEFLAVSYLQVTLWALIPALLYYVACFAAVHFEARSHGLQPLPESEIPRLGTVMRERGHLFIPMLVVIAGLGLGYSATLCALVGAATCLPVALLRRATREPIGRSAVWDALADGARNSVSVAMACACAGIVLGVITLTGSGIAFTAVSVVLARNSLILELLLTMVAGIILGMGMPTTPAYIIMVALLVPALIKLGVVAPAAHMFAFYFAILSAITPPVALAVYAAAGLAKADLWPTGLAAVRVGAAGFIVPFMFVYQPGLLMIGSWTEIAVAAGTGTFGILFLAATLHGHLRHALAMWERAVLLAAALLLIDPNWLTDLIGAAIGGGIWLRQRLATRTAPA